MPLGANAKVVTKASLKKPMTKVNIETLKSFVSSTVPQQQEVWKRVFAVQIDTKHYISATRPREQSGIANMFPDMHTLRQPKVFGSATGEVPQIL